MQQRLWFVRVRGFAVLVGLLSGSICLAQQEEPTAQLEPVVITATRTEVPLSQTTRSVTVITEADIAAQDAQTVADVLRSVPGVDVVRTSSLYTKIDLILGYDVIKDWGPIRTLELFGRVENLLDEDYEEAFGFSAPGIAGFGGVKIVF
jgi:outer membrane cobalamin receptor